MVGSLLMTYIVNLYAVRAQQKLFVMVTASHWSFHAKKPALFMVYRILRLLHAAFINFYEQDSDTNYQKKNVSQYMLLYILAANYGKLA